MSKNSDQVKRWRENTKNRIIEAFGGSCGVCNYNKCSEALDLHHINPQEKEYGIGQIRAHIISWKRICEELKKCVMLCANCHRELHNDIITLSTTIKRFDESYITYKEEEYDQYFDDCPVCGKKKRKHYITCSRECTFKRKGKIKWGLYDVIAMKEIEKLTDTKIAELVGCSGVAVAKRYKKLKRI